MSLDLKPLADLANLLNNLRQIGEQDAKDDVSNPQSPKGTMSTLCNLFEGFTSILDELDGPKCQEFTFTAVDLQKKLKEYTTKLKDIFPPFFKPANLKVRELVNLSYIVLILKFSNFEHRKQQKMHRKDADVLFKIAQMLLDRPWQKKEKELRTNLLNELRLLFIQLAQLSEVQESEQKSFLVYLDILADIEYGISESPFYDQTWSGKQLSREVVEQHICFLTALMNDLSHLILPHLQVVLDNMDACVKESNVTKENPKQFKSKQEGLLSQGKLDLVQGATKHAAFFTSIFKRTTFLRKMTQERVESLRTQCHPIKLKQGSFQALFDVESLMRCTHRLDTGMRIDTENFNEEIDSYLKWLKSLYLVEADQKEMEAQNRKFMQFNAEFYKDLLGKIEKFEKMLSPEQLEMQCHTKNIGTILNLFAERILLLGCGKAADQKKCQEKIEGFKKILVQNLKINDEQFNALLQMPDEGFKKVFDAIWGVTKKRANVYNRGEGLHIPYLSSLSAVSKEFSEIINKLADRFEYADTDNCLSKELFVKIKSILFLANAGQLFSQFNSDQVQQVGLGIKDKVASEISRRFGTNSGALAQDVFANTSVKLKSTQKHLKNLLAATHLLCGPISKVLNSMLNSAFGGWKARVDLEPPVPLVGKLFDDEELCLPVQLVKRKKTAKKFNASPVVKMALQPEKPAPIIGRAKQISDIPEHTQLLTSLHLSLAKANRVQLSILPIMRLGKRQQRAHLARADQLLALRLMTPTLEMLFHQSNHKENQPNALISDALLPLSLLLMFLSAEQALSANIFEKNPDSVVSHSLPALGAPAKSMLVKHLDEETINYRYLTSEQDQKERFEAVPKMLQELTALMASCSKDLNDAELKEQAARLTQGKNPFHSFATSYVLKSEFVQSLQATEKSLSDLCFNLEREIERQLKEGNLHAVDKLKVILKHLKVIKSVPQMICNFPHQRFLVVPAYMLFLSGQYCVEMIGHWLALQHGIYDVVEAFPGEVHQLRKTYCESFQLDAPLNDQECDLMAALDVGKGFEYMNSYCSQRHKASEKMGFLGDLLKWSEASGDFEAAWTPGCESESKDAAEQVAKLQEKLIMDVSAISGMIIKLVERHIFLKF